MPANSKYLTQSKWQRFAKISAAILGSYLVAVSFHLALACWLDCATIVITMAFSGFILWVALMVVSFLAQNGWKLWLLYLALTTLFAGLACWGQIVYPIN